MKVSFAKRIILTTSCFKKNTCLSNCYTFDPHNNPGSRVGYKAFHFSDEKLRQ